MAFVLGARGRVLFAQYDISTYLTEVGIDSAVDTPETTAFQPGVTVPVKSYIPGVPGATVSLAGLFDAGGVPPVAIDDVLTEFFGASDKTFSFGPDGMALGKRVFLAQVHEANYQPATSVADAVRVSASLQCDGAARSGVGLHDLTAESATGNGSSVDNLAASTNGGVAVLHVTANTHTGNTTVKVQHSVDDAAWVDLVTFAVVPASTKASERVLVAALTTVNRYLRAQWTLAGGGGTATFAVGFARL